MLHLSPFPASVSGRLSQAKGQNPHHLWHPWHQTSEDEPGTPQRCMDPFLHRLFIRSYHIVHCIRAIILFACHPSCATKRNTTTAEGSWSLCRLHPSWCTAVMSMRSPVRYGDKTHVFNTDFHQICFCWNGFWNVFVLLVEIQRGSDVAERPWLLLVWHPRDGPCPQHYQTKGMCFHYISFIHFYVMKLTEVSVQFFIFFIFTFIGELSSGR